ncbi:2OG-Fe(II) oxygenase [bacterium]|nr:2OG-Fe(II) oxygenase [bacterium]
MLKWINLPNLEAAAEDTKEVFQKALPFKHLVLDDLVEAGKVSQLCKAFPEKEWDGWTDVGHEHQFKKSICKQVDLMPDSFSELVSELNSGPFIKWLESITGVKNILPDPNLFGGGLHLTGIGGTLTPHIDFHVVKGFPLFRRINLILYLNEGWEESDGGQLELWDKAKDEISIKVPSVAGRCVVFLTDSVSLHGFTTPVANKSRKSVAMYYYTAEDAEKFGGDEETYWRSDSISKEGGGGDRRRLIMQRLFLGGARISSGISWRLKALASKYSK